MKKLVIKSVVITLACVVAVGAIAYILLVTVFPGALASIYGNMGGYEQAARYEINAYDKSGNVLSIVAAGDYAVKSGKDELIVATVDKFISDDEYGDYTKNNALHSAFLTSKYIVARYNTEGGGQAVVDKAFSMLLGYDSHNQVESLLVAAYDKGDADTLRLISVGLDLLDTSAFSEDQLAVLNRDKEVVQKALS